MAFCSNCGHKIDDNDKICKYCGEHLTNADTTEYVYPQHNFNQTPTGKKKKGFTHRFLAALPFLVLAVIFFAALFVFYCIKSNIPSWYELAVSYGKYSSQTVEATLQRDTYSYCIEYAAVAGAIFVLFAIIMFCGQNKKASAKAIILKIVCFSVVGAVVFSAIYAFEAREHTPAQIQVQSQSKLNFEMMRVHGSTRVAFTQEFQDDVYKYYKTVTEAFNALKRTGDYDAFFKKVYSGEFDELNKQVFDLSFGHKTPSCDEYFVDRSKVDFMQIPKQSLREVHIATEDYFDIYSDMMKKYGKDNLGEFRDSLVDYAVDSVNILTDIFYGEELVLATERDYSAERLQLFFGNNFKHENGNNELEIKSIDSNVKFLYTGLSDDDSDIYTASRSKNKAQFSYTYTPSGKKGYGLIHFIGTDKVIININDEFGDKYVKSDSFSYDDIVYD